MYMYILKNTHLHCKFSCLCEHKTVAVYEQYCICMYISLQLHDDVTSVKGH